MRKLEEALNLAQLAGCSVLLQPEAEQLSGKPLGHSVGIWWEVRHSKATLPEDDDDKTDSSDGEYPSSR